MSFMTESRKHLQRLNKNKTVIPTPDIHCTFLWWCAALPRIMLHRVLVLCISMHVYVHTDCPQQFQLIKVNCDKPNISHKVLFISVPNCRQHLAVFLALKTEPTAQHCYKSGNFGCTWPFREAQHFTFDQWLTDGGGQAVVWFVVNMLLQSWRTLSSAEHLHPLTP